MAKSSHEIIQKYDYCKNLEKDVFITLTYLVHPAGFRALTEFDCKSVHDCGVSKEGPRGVWTFDWEKCPLKDYK
jgi:hypothetical protein